MTMSQQSDGTVDVKVRPSSHYVQAGKFGEASREPTNIIQILFQQSALHTIK